MDSATARARHQGAGMALDQAQMEALAKAVEEAKGIQ
ncbi:hypothetical protein QFZ22_000292 [Streptomyces canus]|uniref:Uncharacterized protein n=1 Tax=Streptomyces canus TaxID=58343 RepID=A0AAW8F2J3_9ACTN|nr:hypothetical protein [Streptomyces canus]